MKSLQIFIGYDHAENVAYNVLCNSIWRHASVPVSITPISLAHLDSVMTRPRDPLQSNDFSFSRFLVPYLCGYEGNALFMDCDMLVVDDVAKLFNMYDSNYAVQVVKHDHNPKNTVAYHFPQCSCCLGLIIVLLSAPLSPDYGSMNKTSIGEV